jgi:glycosyltransferase involved in cell wall biosynthesis
MLSKRPNILIAGPLPPPSGGISIHLLRLKYLLSREFKIDVIDESPIKKSEYFNLRSFNLVQYLKKVKHTDVFFVHSGNRIFKKLHILMAKLMGKKLILTIHGYGNKRNNIMRMLDSLFFNMADKIILVNSTITNKLKLDSNKCIVKHAFLPPVMTDEPDLPLEIIELINRATLQNKLIVCANASRLDTFNNEDLYGLDLCLKAALKLKRGHIPIQFIFVVTDKNKNERYLAALDFIKEHQLENIFCLLNTELSFVKLIQLSDVVLRPTNTDGDSLTVREALFLNKIVVASDVVERPEGTVLFKTRDVESLVEKLIFYSRIEEKNHYAANNYSEDDYYLFYEKLFADVCLNKKLKKFDR